MTMNITDVHTTPVVWSADPWARLRSWLLAIVRPRQSRQDLSDFPDSQLADLNIRRSDIEAIDPRQVRLF